MNGDEYKKNEALVQKIKNDLSSNKLVPVKIWRGGSFSNAKEDAGIEIDYARSFIIIEAAKKNKNGTEKFIYKRKIEDKEDPKLQIEAECHRWILPEIYNSLPLDIQKHVKFPRLIDEIKENGKTVAFIRENLEGEICGDYHSTKKNIWNKKDLEAILEVIKGFQKIAPGRIAAAKKQNVLEIYKEKYGGNFRYLKKLLGEGYEKKYTLLEKEANKQIKKQKSVLLSLDVACYNIIKMQDGRLGFFDWEGVFIGKDPSLDYRRLILKLWTNPDLRQTAIAIALNINKDNIYFRELLRVNLVRGTYLNYYYTELKNKDKKRKARARAAIRSFKGFIKDALDNKGVWKNN